MALKIFENHGNVVDVFIPRKRSGLGKRYGFVRFASRPAALTVIRRLNGVRLLDHRIGVNIARFKGRTSYWRKVSTSKKPTNVPSYVQVASTPGISNFNPVQKVVSDSRPDSSKCFPCSSSKSMMKDSVPYIKSC
ncbi:hypothetical protein REPUB_Repub03eG0183200 [Reevesia pubescens]